MARRLTKALPFSSKSGENLTSFGADLVANVSAPMTAPHTVLGVAVDASPEEIRTAWRALVRRSHPDVVGQSIPVEDRMKSINVAYHAMLDALAQVGKRAPRAPAWEKMTPSKPCARKTQERDHAKDRVATRARRPQSTSRSSFRPQPRPAPSSDSPRRKSVSSAMDMRLRAALIGRLRQILNQENARLGGAAYTVRGQSDWKSDEAVALCGGLPEQYRVTHIDFDGSTISLRLSASPVRGRALVALPRLTLDTGRRLSEEPAVTVLEIDVPEGQGSSIVLSADDAALCVAGSSDVNLELRFPVVETV